MSTIPVTLDTIRAAAELKYGGYAIALSETETLTLRNPLRMPKRERDAMGSLQERLNADTPEGEAEVDQEEILSELLTLVADNKGLGQRFVDMLGGDLVLLMETFSQYGDKVQVGEASASQG